MIWILLDIFLCLSVYVFLLSFILKREQKKNRNSDDTDDGEGGIPSAFPPDFDLPPGICLPDDPRRFKRKVTEEVLA